MSFDILVTLLVLGGAVALFVTEKVRVDVVGLMAMAILLGAGVLAPESALAGFSNPATVTVAAMFILSAGLLKTGAGEVAGQVLARLAERSFALG
ncbi:MAG: SLC13 family permease, partial [Acidobacteriota bacterium]